MLSRLADRYCLVGQGVEVDRDAEGGADLVLAAVAPADVAAGLVVLHAEPPLLRDLDAGGSTEAGPSTSAALHRRALADPRTYFNSAEADGGAALLTRTKTDGVNVGVGSVVRAVADLIRSLAQPSAFLVRMLDTKDPQLTTVDRFFEEVVVPVIRELGYDPIVMGEGRTDSLWMNVDIFERLSRCQMAVIDITGLRNNCFMELGYAYGRGLRVLLTGRQLLGHPSMQP